MTADVDLSTGAAESSPLKSSFRLPLWASRTTRTEFTFLACSLRRYLHGSSMQKHECSFDITRICGQEPVLVHFGCPLDGRANRLFGKRMHLLSIRMRTLQLQSDFS